MKLLSAANQDSQLRIQEFWETRDQLIPLMRIALALLALLIFLAHQREESPRSQIISIILGSYALYGIWLCIRTRREDRLAMVLRPWLHWIDVAWYFVLISLSRGGGSILFIGLLFPMIVASFRYGFMSGVRVTVVSALLFSAVSAAYLPKLETGHELNLILSKSAWLLGIGYIVARWGGAQRILQCRLEFILGMTSHFNPRFGIDRTVAFILERLREFYGAQFSLMVLNDSGAEEFRLQRTGAEETARFEPVAPEIGRRLMNLSPGNAAVYNAKNEEWWRPGKSDQLLDVALGRAIETDRSKLDGVAAMLGAESFLSAPVKYRSKDIGRLYVVSERPVFVPSDMSFLVAVLQRLNPVIENTRLVELLSSYAADDERLKIARDIHDSVIQPYFGLRIGLEALHENTKKDFPALSRQIEQLMQSAETGINDLRRYVAGLKQSTETDGGLLPAMRRFAARFSETTGIAVKIETEGDIHANERLAAEAFQMMTEGLSNIRKHTHSMRAKVRVCCRLGHFTLEIKNEGLRGLATPFFTPASISERTAALGGKIHVSKLPDGGNAVLVDIPL